MTIDEQSNGAMPEDDQSTLPEGLMASQADLTKRLIDKGVNSIDVIYFGSDGMVGVADVQTQPRNVDLSDMIEEIARFSTELLAWKEGRFEMGRGGEGCLTLDAQDANIKLTHSEFGSADKDREKKALDISDLIKNGTFGPDDVVIIKFMDAFKRHGVNFVNTWFYNNIEDGVYEYEGRLSDKPIDLKDLQSAADIFSTTKRFKDAVLADIKETGVFWDLSDFMRCVSECADKETANDDVDSLSTCGNVYLDVQAGTIVCEICDNFEETIVREALFVLPNESVAKPQHPRA